MDESGLADFCQIVFPFPSCGRAGSPLPAVVVNQNALVGSRRRAGDCAPWLPATAGLMLRDVRLPDTKLTAAPGSASFRADCGLSAGDGRLSSVGGERLAVDGERLAVDGERLAVDGERLAVDGERLAAVQKSYSAGFQFTVNHHRNRI